MRTLLFGLCDNSKDFVEDFNHKDVVSKLNLPKFHLSFITHAFHSSLLYNTDTFIDREVVCMCIFVCLYLQRSSVTLRVKPV